MSRSRGPRLAVVVTLAVALAACETGPSEPAGSTSVASVAPTSAPSAGVGTPGAGSVAPAPSFVAGDGDLFLDPIEGLDGLTSHLATLAWTFTGTVDGHASTWTETTSMRSAKNPAAAELTIERSGIAGAPARSWRATVGGTAFAADDTGPCSASPPAAEAFVEPAASLSALIGGVQTGTDTVDGLAAHVFQFDGRAMGLVQPVQVTGRAWLSESDDLLLRLEVAIDAGPDYFGAGVSGQLRGRYELSAIGASVDVTIPSTCPAGVLEGLRPTDASNVVSVPGQLTLHTAMTVQAAMAFYRDTSLAFGWKATADPRIQTDPAVAVLAFANADIAITVLITAAADGGSDVVITAGRT